METFKEAALRAAHTETMLDAERPLMNRNYSEDASIFRGYRTHAMFVGEGRYRDQQKQPLLSRTGLRSPIAF